MAADYVTKKQLDDALEGLYERVREEHKQYRDEVITKLDQIVGELQTMREENMIGVYHTRELRETVEDHEKRIKKLEHH